MATPEKLAGALQENILALLVTSDDHCQTVKASIDIKLYSNAIFRTIAERTYDFIEAHGKAPRDHLPDLLEDHIADTREGRLYSEMMHGLRMLGETLNIPYVLNSLAAFVQEHTLRLGIIAAADALGNEDVSGARAAIEAALRRTAPTFDPGITLLQALESLRLGHDQRDVIPTGIQVLDHYHLGPARQELWMVVAGPKRGKTWCLISLTRSALIDRRKVLYITLEVRDTIIARRIIQSLTGMKAKESDKLVRVPVIPDKVLDGKSAKFFMEYKEVERGHIEPTPAERELGRLPAGLRAAHLRIGKLRLNDRLMIKAFPTGNLSVRELVAYLDQLERLYKFVPDLVIVDYADLMTIDKDNYRISMGNTLKELRGEIAVTRNVAMATASQLNRVGAASIRASEVHVAEDFSKVAISDVVTVINQSNEEKDDGTGRMWVAASRNDRDKFGILYTQNLEIGQFCINSMMEPFTYKDWLKDIRQGADDADLAAGREE